MQGKRKWGWKPSGKILFDDMMERVELFFNLYNVLYMCINTGYQRFTKVFFAYMQKIFLLCVLLGTPPELLGASPPLRSAAEILYPPFSFIDEEGDASGFSVALLRAALDAVDYDVVFRTGTWSEVRHLLLTGEIDVLPIVGRTPEREELFSFTFPYIALFGGVIIRDEDRERIGGIEDLRGRQVAVMQDDVAEEYLRRDEPDIHIATTTTYEQALRELAAGAHDAVILQRLIGMQLLDALELEGLVLLPRPLTDFRQEYAFAVQKGDSALLGALNDGLAHVISDGTWRRLYAEWFAEWDLANRRQLLVGGDYDFPPYEFLNADGEPDGFLVALMHAIGEQMGLDLEIRLGPWASTVEALESGELDVIQGMFYSEERSRTFDFSLPYSYEHYVAVTQRGERSPQSIHDLEGLRVAVQDGDLMHEVVSAWNDNIEILAFGRPEDVLRAVRSGIADCGIVLRQTATEMIRRNGWTELAVGRQALHEAPYCLAVARGNTALLAQLNEGLRILQESGEYRKIYERWFGIAHQPHSSRSLVIVITWVAGPLVFILLVLLVWWWSLRKLVAKRTQELRTSEARFRALFENKHTTMLLINPENGIIEDANPAAAAFYGWSCDILRTMNISEINTMSRDQIHKEMEDARSKERHHFSFQHRLADGSVRDVDVYSGPLEVDGRTLLYSFVFDATWRHRTQARILHLNRVLRSIRDINQLIIHEQDRGAFIETACRLLSENRGYVSALFALTDTSGALQEWSVAGEAAATEHLQQLLESGALPPCCRIMKARQDPVVMRDNAHVCENCPLGQIADENTSIGLAVYYDERIFGYLIVAAPGQLEADSEECALLAEMAEDLGFALFSMEVEENRSAAEAQNEQLSAQLAQAQKLEAVGRLAGGVAHDFNNLLMGIMGCAEMCKDDLSAGHPNHDLLDEILDNARRSADLTRQLLAFARREPVSPLVLYLNEVIEGMLKLLHRLLGENVSLEWSPGRDLWPILMDPTQIDQILANLCVNARDAINGVGTLRIQTSNRKITDSEARCHTGYIRGDFVMLSVADDGSGMSEEVQAQIFDPFYTTKSSGRGTGLGLSTVYGIIQQNNGFVDVTSEPGVGTTFRIYFPRTEQPVSIDAETQDTDRGKKATETILLVEDEDSIRNVLARSLEHLGYNVLAAGTTHESIRIAKTYAGTIHLLLTDVIMPEMNGKELAAELQRLRPDMRVLFMSGYTADVITQQGRIDSDVDFIQKPVTQEVLSSTIRELLDRA